MPQLIDRRTEADTMPKIFISYRREDSFDVTGRIDDRLASHFGRDHVFRDIDTIPAGRDFRDHLAEGVSNCDALLAIIGPDWLTSFYVDGPHRAQRRLDHERDFVRVEIETALERGILVIPVLVRWAEMPREAQLPECLKPLAYRNAVDVRSGKDFHGQMDKLIHDLEKQVGVAAGDASSMPASQIQVVPKGLRSFDKHDADYFLQLLPGPYDRRGLPESLLFWMSRIHETDPDCTFRVGVIYGPSGSGKSSLVKAGLLPRLADTIVPVYVEATPNDTETRILNGLRRRVSGLSSSDCLPDVISSICDDGAVAPGQKVLIVVDQFEQWLHVHGGEENTELLAALRLCDARRVQCVVIVRADFWMAVTQFMQDLELRLVEGENSRAVDLFPVQHANRVLTAFGRAFGTLPVGELTADQRDFVGRAIAGLAQDGKVVCVRLALFSEMMKGRVWTPAVLKQVGGSTGIGVTFLEETFAAPNAAPEHRYHQKAARAVLKALIPGAGAEIRGHIRSVEDLLAASGYTSRPKDFDNLIRILDREVRLITPTNPDDADEDGDSSPQIEAGKEYYQLTHDYLVPSLNEWLTRKQKETRRGRAELRLGELADAWKAKPERRNLPSWWENVNIRLLTRSKTWTDDQRKMMSNSARLHGLRCAFGIALVFVMLSVGMYISRRLRADTLVNQISTAEVSEVVPLIRQLADVRDLADPQLQQWFTSLPKDAPEKLKASLALLDSDPGQATFLTSRTKSLQPSEVRVVRSALAKQPTATQIADDLWEMLDQISDDEELLPVASVVAKLTPVNDQRWRRAGPKIAEALVLANIFRLREWLELLHDVRESMLLRLTDVYSDRSSEQNGSQRKRATEILSLYAADRPELLAELLLAGDAEQFKTLFPLASSTSNTATTADVFRQELVKRILPEWLDPEADPGWQTPDAGALAAIEAAPGIVDIDEGFAFCLSMSRNKFVQVAEQLRGAGFRPTRVRPFVVEQQLYIAAVWRQDSLGWSLEWDLDKSALLNLTTRLSHQSQRPTDIAGYVTPSAGEPMEHYVLLRSDKSDVVQSEYRLFVGLSEKELEKEQEQLAQQGLPTIDTLHVFRGTDGSTKYSGIWSSSGAKPTTLVTGYGGWERVDLVAWDISLVESRTPDPTYRYTQQLATVGKALQAHPHVAHLVLDRAKAHFWLGNDKQALADLNQLLGSDTISAEVHHYRAWVLARQGNEGEAKDALDRFMQATDSHSQRMYVQVVLTAWLGDGESALHQLNETVAEDQITPNVLYDAACAASMATLSDDVDIVTFSDRALQLLSDAIAAGYDDSDRLMNDPHFSPLHTDHRFQGLAARLLGPRGYAGLWRPDTEFESRMLCNLSLREQVRQSTELSSQGYRPISVGVMQPHEGAVLLSASLWHRPLAAQDAIEQLAIRQQNAAVGLLRLKRADEVWPLLRHQADPRLRSYLIHRFADVDAEAESLLKRLAAESNSSGRRAILLSLGKLARNDSLEDAHRLTLIQLLLNLYREDPDPGIHGAAEWTLKQFGQEKELDRIDVALATGAAVSDRQWYVTKQHGHTLAILQPTGAFLMGSPVTESERQGGPTGRNEIRHQRTIPRRFAIGMKEVTVRQFRAFKSGHKLNRYANEEEAPVNLISWYKAAEFCNWLSKQEGISPDDWCYVPAERFEDGMRMFPDYLERSGYRLPTEAEWEFACRAGATTARYFGETDTLLDQYACYRENTQETMLTVGTLKPNDFGLFDMLGNAYEWCQDFPSFYPTDRLFVEDVEQRTLTVQDNQFRVWRGGCFSNPALYLRSAYRNPAYPYGRVVTTGFRLARTYNLPP